MNIGKSFSFQFEDKEWLSKLGLCAIIILVPILNFAWSGYIVATIRNVTNKISEPLPTWDDLGKKFSDGLTLFGARIVYALPLLIALCIPLGILAFSGVLSSDSDLQDLSRIMGEVGGGLLYCLLCFFVLYALVLSIIFPAILVMYADQGTFASCFNFRGVLSMVSRKSGPFLTAWGMSLVAGFGVGLVVGLINATVGWIPCLGWILSLVISAGSTAYFATVYAHLFGQFGAISFGQS